MKNKFLIIIMLVLLLVVGCKNDNKDNNKDNNKNDKDVAYNGNKWQEKTFFSNVDAPKEKVDKFSQDYSQNGKENYSVIINEFSYNDFYNYIMELEKDGFHYEFVSEYVPSDISKLNDKTETSWSGSKDNVYIIATWRSNDNIYYNGYNLHLLFYNYDYTNISNN